MEKTFFTVLRLEKEIYLNVRKKSSVKRQFFYNLPLSLRLFSIRTWRHLWTPSSHISFSYLQKKLGNFFNLFLTFFSIEVKSTTTPATTTTATTTMTTATTTTRVEWTTYFTTLARCCCDLKEVSRCLEIKQKKGNFSEKAEFVQNKFLDLLKSCNCSKTKFSHKIGRETLKYMHFLGTFLRLQIKEPSIFCYIFFNMEKQRKAWIVNSKYLLLQHSSEKISLKRSNNATLWFVPAPITRKSDDGSFEVFCLWRTTL